MEIPEGPFQYGDKKTDITLPAFKIARYPVTNSQCFIDDGGYAGGRWWQGLAETPLPSGEGQGEGRTGPLGQS